MLSPLYLWTQQDRSRTPSIPIWSSRLYQFVEFQTMTGNCETLNNKKGLQCEVPLFMNPKDESLVVYYSAISVSAYRFHIAPSIFSVGGSACTSPVCISMIDTSIAPSIRG